MNEDSTLEMRNLAKSLETSSLLIATSVSVVIEALSRHGENMHCQFNSVPYAPYGQDGFKDLLDILDKAITASKKKSPPIPPKRKNNIINKQKDFTLSPQTPLPHVDQDEAEAIKESQTKKKLPLSDEFVDRVTTGDIEHVPAQWRFYAERKGFKGDLFPVFEDFVTYHRKKNSKMANWYMAWQTWVRNQMKFHPECARPAGMMGGKVMLTKENMGDLLEN